MANRTANIIAALLLALMLGLSFFAMLGNSQTMDEVSHLPAGYSYITQKDMRINPEHPSLVKDLAGLSVWTWSKISGNKINFPYNLKAWKDDINGQWDFGFNFMYKSGNNADKMLFFGRLPMFLILLLLGFYVFKWAKELFGNRAGLLALFLFSFSPTFIAHGSLVTTDVAAATGIFISLYYFIRWLKNPSTKNLVIAGIIFGLALLAKFSTVLLAPLFIFLILVWIAIKIHSRPMPVETTITKKKIFCKYFCGLILIGAMGLIIIYPVYLYHVWNYPMNRQVSDMRFVLNSHDNLPGHAPLEACKKLSISKCPAQITIWMAQKPVLRPWAQYFYGLLMVFQRATGGNTTYFWGEVSNSGWKIYFPTVYAIKEPLAMHILTLIALIFAAYATIKAGSKKIFNRLANWIQNHIAETGMLSFIALYWASSITSPLNIGVRHILPTFPLIYLLTSNQISKWLSNSKPCDAAIITENEEAASRPSALSKLKYALLFLLILWQAVSVIRIYPYFLTYFNELVGGPSNGHKYVTDSNLDWGQDFKRLTNWVNENKINTIYVDYFGGTVGEYYLDGKLKPWSGDRDPSALPPNSYLAVSATFLQGCFGKPVPGFSYPSCYQWIKNYQPITVIGNSIFVYRIP